MAKRSGGPEGKARGNRLPRARIVLAATAATLALLVATGGSVRADGNLHNVNHIIIVMQENHSFDNYFGVLPYASGTPYHGGGGKCAPYDHTCVDGLSCTRDSAGNYTCTNSNVDDDTSTVFAFHDAKYATGPDIQHNWPGSHSEANYNNPAGALAFSPNDGFVLVNDATEQIDNGESPTDDDTMGFYNETDLPFYYGLAKSFAIDDRYFCSVVGPTFPNRSYEMAATSFGHLTTNEIFPPSGGYKPITGTIFDLLDQNGQSWNDSILFITYDEHGGFYDHVAPAAARQGGALNPDGINPGQCEDLSNPPASEQPGGGAQCDVSRSDAAAICPGFTATGPYPANCANFNQLGFRVPFIAVSPFSKPHYVSHTVGDHASLLALIEKRFLSLADGGGTRPHLTARDQYAATLEDMFDFNKAPSMNTSVPTAPPPTAGDPGCS